MDDRDVTLHAWGANSPATPVWQRPLLRLLFPILRILILKSFRITDANYQRAVTRIDEILGEADAWLEDGRKSLLGGGALNYTDFAFAAMTGLLFMPPGYGGGKAEAVRLTLEQVPEVLVPGGLDDDGVTRRLLAPDELCRGLQARALGHAARPGVVGHESHPRERGGPQQQGGADELGQPRYRRRRFGRRSWRGLGHPAVSKMPTW